MPAYWKWFSYLDFIRYSWGALMKNQFSGPKGDPVWLNGRTVLEHYGLKNYHDDGGQRSSKYTWYTPTVEMWADFGFMWIFFSGFFCLAWAMLRSKKLTIR